LGAGDIAFNQTYSIRGFQVTKPKTSARKRSAPLSIIDCINDPAIWQPWFKSSITWAAWFAFLKVMFGLPMSEADLATFRTCTGRDQPSPEGYLEATLVIGRRGGKSLVLALIAAYLACFRDWTPYLAPGERGHIVVIAPDKKQA
jgi:hypothetical protein